MDILIEISVVLPLSLPLDFWPASLAQSDARPTGDQDQDVAVIKMSRVRSPPGPEIFYRGDWSWNILSLPLTQEEQLSVSGERMCTSAG